MKVYRFNQGEYYAVSETIEEAIEQVTKDLQIQGKFVPRNYESYPLPEVVE